MGNRISASNACLPARTSRKEVDMNVLSTKGLATGMFIILCCGLWGCNDPDKRLTGQWELYEYEDGLRTESESSLLTITSEDEFVLDSPGTLLGILDYRYTVEGPYMTERSASPPLVTFQYDILGVDVTNVGIYRFEGPFWNRTLFLALNYEAGEDAESLLNKDGGPVLVGEKVPDSKVVQQGIKFLEKCAQFMK